MAKLNPFDTRIEILGKSSLTPAGVIESATFVNDTLELAWMSAAEVFGDKATPEVALAIYDRIAARLPAKPKGSR